MKIDKEEGKNKGILKKVEEKEGNIGWMIGGEKDLKVEISKIWSEGKKDKVLGEVVMGMKDEEKKWI